MAVTSPSPDPYHQQPYQPSDVPYIQPPAEQRYPPISPPYGQPPVSPGFASPYGQPYGQPPPQISYVVKQPTSTTAIASVIAVILGHVALKETAGGQKEGHGMAVTGLILGYIGVLPALFISITWGIGMVTGQVDPTTTPTP
jgi:hypothetical protein